MKRLKEVPEGPVEPRHEKHRKYKGCVHPYPHLTPPPPSHGRRGKVKKPKKISRVTVRPR